MFITVLPLVFSTFIFYKVVVMMQLWCAGIYHNHIIANCLQSVPVKEYAAVKGPPLRYSS